MTSNPINAIAPIHALARAALAGAGAIALLQGCATSPQPESEPPRQQATVPRPAPAPVAKVAPEVGRAAPTPRAPAPPRSLKDVRQSRVEIVAADAATLDGGNGWGGHQSRIVRTVDGIFTAYVTDTGDKLRRQWHLAHRQQDGSWKTMANGVAGREPVNLLAAPSGTLYLIGWPDGVGTMWSGKPRDGALRMTRAPIPRMAVGHWPYASAGIDGAGNPCVLASSGGDASGGRFDWACYQSLLGTWRNNSITLDFRYAYTYVFPERSGRLSLVSTRDVTWEALGYARPPGAFAYVYNAFSYWRTGPFPMESLRKISHAEELPTPGHLAAHLSAQMDAYLDTLGRMHILYVRSGASTGGKLERRRRIMNDSGELIHDAEIPRDAGRFCRMFQDSEGRFYLIGSAGLLYPLDRDGIEFGEPVKLDLGGFAVEYSGFGVSVPRTGTPPGDIIDVVFPSGKGSKWLYFSLDLSAGH